MELLKSIIAWALSPLIIGVGLELLGFLFLGFSRRRAAGILIALGVAILITGSLPVLTYAANRQREGIHAPFRPASVADFEAPALIVVLGTGLNPDPKLPATARLDSTLSARLLEGVRVHRLLPESRLLVSLAGDVASVEEKRRTLHDLIRILQVDPDRVDLLTAAQSTADEAAMTAVRIRAGESVVVATSAAHMPRAVKVFADEGLDPIAAPTDYHRPRRGSTADQPWKRWIPSTHGLQETEAWLYEFAAGLVR